MTHKLVFHPDTPRSDIVISADAIIPDNGLAKFRYVLRGAIDGVVWPAPDGNSPTFRDGLWQTTCFEAFCKRSDDGTYHEFNLSPSGDWAAYAFRGYRAGMASARTVRGLIVAVIPGRDEMVVEGICDPSDLAGASDFGLSAVIEHRDGTKSYWALAHPPGAPDFHHPDCFALKVPAVAGA